MDQKGARVTSTPYPRLFEPYTMNTVELRNRIVFAAHGTRFTDPHTLEVTRRQADYFVERVKGGAGLIIQGARWCTRRDSRPPA